MKLKDWIEFNQPLLNSDLAVKVLKNKSYKTDDILFETCADVDVCLKFFGDYEMRKFMVQDRPHSGGKTIGVLLWAEAE